MNEDHQTENKHVHMFNSFSNLNDSESSIIQSSNSSNFDMLGGNYKKLYNKNNCNYYQIKAFWIKDTSKCIIVDINENDNVKYLLRKIGERMEETHDDFRGLRHC